MRMRQGWFHRDTSVNFVNFDMSVLPFNVLLRETRVSLLSPKIPQTSRVSALKVRDSVPLRDLSSGDS